MLPATRLHAIARRTLHDRMTSLGFRPDRRTGRAGWTRTHEGVDTDIVVVPSAYNFSEGRGRFTIDMSEADERQGRVTNDRLTSLLNGGQRERLREVINAVRRRMRPPDPDDLREFSEGERRVYLAAFAPVEAPFPPASDVWFEYVDERDAVSAFAFVAEVLPTCLDALRRVGLEEHARRTRDAAGADQSDAALAMVESIRSSLRRGSWSERDPEPPPCDR